MKNSNLQFIWWGKKIQGFGFWAWPKEYKTEKVFKGKPVFYGLRLGIIELRWFVERPTGVLFNKDEEKI